MIQRNLQFPDVRKKDNIFFRFLTKTNYHQKTFPHFFYKELNHYLLELKNMEVKMCSDFLEENQVLSSS